MPDLSSRNQAPCRSRRGALALVAAVFFWILAAQLWLVQHAGSDVPFMDQWNVEGAWLYPRELGGSLRLEDFFRPHNEHRIAFTHLLNAALFHAAGRWDPLLQLTAGAMLHAAVSGLLAGMLLTGLTGVGRVLAVSMVAILTLPGPGWHNALWGFQTQIYFVVLFSLIAVAGFAAGDLNWRWRVVGLLGAIASLFAMGAGLATPVALAGVILLSAGRDRPFRFLVRFLPVLLVGLIALAARVSSPPLEDLHATSVNGFFEVLVRLLAWPWSDLPWMLLLLNLPLAWLLVARIRRQKWAGGLAADFALGTGLWSATVMVAQAWARGGGAEMLAGIPSRYVDFYVLLPLANVAALMLWWESQAGTASVARIRLIGAAWLAILLLGWAVAAESAWIHVLAPRIADRAAPERLLEKFVRSRDPAVFAGQPRLLTPHPDLSSVTRVLDDPAMKDHLPPTLEPAEPLRPISRLARAVLAASKYLFPAAGIGLVAALLFVGFKREPASAEKSAA